MSKKSYCTNFEAKNNFKSWLLLSCLLCGKKVNIHNLEVDDIYGFGRRNMEYLTLKLKKDISNNCEYIVNKKLINRYIHINWGDK